MGLAELCHAVQAHEGIEQLKVNLKKEHDLKVDYMTAVWINVCSSHALIHASTDHTTLHERILLAQASMRCCHLSKLSPGRVACMYRAPQHCHALTSLCAVASCPRLQSLAVVLARQAAVPELRAMSRMHRC